MTFAMDQSFRDEVFPLVPQATHEGKVVSDPGYQHANAKHGEEQAEVAHTGAAGGQYLGLDQFSEKLVNGEAETDQR
jgi:hypothetical protein